MSDLHPWTRAARTIGRMGAQSCRRVFHKESRYAGGSDSREFEVRDDGRRSESFDCIALTGDAEGGPRHEGFTLAPRKARQLPLELEFGEAVPSDAKERQRWDCIFVIGSSSRSRRGGSASNEATRAARSEAGPPKLAQANSSATTRKWIRSARTASGPERSSPFSLMHETARTKYHSCGPHLRI